MKKKVLATIKKGSLRTAALIAFLLFTMELFRYFLNEYLPFVSVSTWQTYLIGLLRMTLRLGYPVALIGIFFYCRWGMVLFFSVWLGQLIPSTIYFLVKGYPIGIFHLVSLLQLLFAAGLLYWCRKLFPQQKIRPPLLIFLAASVAIHSLIWGFVYAVHNY